MAQSRIRSKGAYAPLSAHYYKDDAIDEAGPDAELLYIRGLAFCAEMLNDGFISDRQLIRFVGVGLDDVMERAKTLAAVGLWGRVDGGHVVRSWLEWNRSRAEVTRHQEKDAARKRGEEPASDPDSPPPEDPEPSARSPHGVRTESESPSWGIHPPDPDPDPDPEETFLSETAEPPADEESDAEPQREDVAALCGRLAEWMITNGARPPTITKQWRREARLLLDRDKRELSKALNLIDWCQQDPFWLTNIHSIPKFRKQYDQLTMKAREDWRRNAARPKTTRDAYGNVYSASSNAWA